MCLNTYIVFIFLSNTMSDWSSFKSVKHLLLLVIVQWLTLISRPVREVLCWLFYLLQFQSSVLFIQSGVYIYFCWTVLQLPQRLLYHQVNGSTSLFGVTKVVNFLHKLNLQSFVQRFRFNHGTTAIMVILFWEFLIFYQFFFFFFFFHHKWNGQWLSVINMVYMSSHKHTWEKSYRRYFFNIKKFRRQSRWLTKSFRMCSR